MGVRKQAALRSTGSIRVTPDSGASDAAAVGEIMTSGVCIGPWSFAPPLGPPQLPVSVSLALSPP